MKFNITNFVWMAAFALGAFGLYLVKYSVQEVQRDVASLEAQLNAEKENVHLLEAEWAYLNRPERLRQLAEGRMEVQPVASAQIIEVSRLPLREAAIADMQVGAGDGLVHRVSERSVFAPVVAR